MTSESAQPARLGRPRSEAAASHARILDAVHALLQETSVRDLTMEAVARRAGVGKPTLYKWWPTKAALVLAMFHERLAGQFAATPAQALAQFGEVQAGRTHAREELALFVLRVAFDAIGERDDQRLVARLAGIGQIGRAHV